MKNLILLGILVLSVDAFSQTVKEYDENQEKTCYQELKDLGCVDTNGKQDNFCAESKKYKLSKICARMHEEKKN